MSNSGQSKWLAASDLRRLRENRGSGHGSEYVPWLKIHEISSKGQKHQLKGVTTGRTHHLLSSLEAAYFRLFDWRTNVVDIREQYPMLPIEATLDIANDLGIKHPNMTKVKGKYHVLTADFVLTSTLCGVNYKTIALSCKYDQSLVSNATIARQEIEKIYFDKYAIDQQVASWAIITESSIPIKLLHNLQLLTPDIFHLLSRNDIERVKHFLVNQKSQHVGALRLAELCAEHIKLDQRVALNCLRYLIYYGFFDIDLKEKFNFYSPLIIAKKGEYL
ncbi:TnsA endonuclease N-terminal domain-containing protein [Deinococcus arenicola]|uniref:TnsA endonuclease N-terminal domain-containing protein n=1 Tax=Deinococcus arenicola TaxID=2994950 RepID=A0ABU4DP41_9DEIO|nr:TnsA endonuclease N-terminal domain-containing protein [Deinococcus sp. ZS9-10]MDV6374175.1 TnsA endonuclease N-terminal domain-containing protein [Deinococcus sp. ZS9-10]